MVGIWYGKGPGVDRSGEFSVTPIWPAPGKNCAALVLAGDDHSCKSSTIPHQSDFSLYNVGIPFLYPGNTQEIIDYGLLAIALSRFSGAWVGLKLVTDICDGGGTVIVDPDQPAIRIPEGYQKTVDARLVPPITLALEHEVNSRRLQAAHRVRAAESVESLARTRAKARGWASPAPGKSYYDLMQALRDLGIGEDDLAELGIRIAKFGMTFPLDAEFAREFAEGLETILVIEEKRSFLELHLRDALYALPSRPVVIGKIDAEGAPLFPPPGELDPDRIAQVVGRAAGVAQASREQVAARVRLYRRRERASARDRVRRAAREFLFGLPAQPVDCCCCPAGRRGGGIGCHTMAMRLIDSNRSFSFLTQMGGEGAPWIGMAPFVGHEHVFQNIGDGTFFHSGIAGGAGAGRVGAQHYL